MFDKTKNWLTILAALGTLIIAVYTLWPSKYELSYSIKEVKLWSEEPDSAILKTIFLFDEKEVDNVYSFTIEVINSGNKNLIGKGDQKSIIGNEIFLEINQISNILNSSIKKNEPKSSFKFGDNNIVISFDKWLTNESIEIDFMTSSIDTIAPKIHMNDRQLVDGRIIPLVEKSRIDIINEVVDQTPSFFLGFTGVVFVWITIIGSIQMFTKPYFSINGFYRLKKWEKLYSNDFNNFVNDLDYLSEEEKSHLKNNIPKVPSLIWKSYEGVQPNVSSDIEQDSVLFVSEILTYTLIRLPLLYVLFLLVYSMIMD